MAKRILLFFFITATFLLLVTPEVYAQDRWEENTVQECGADYESIYNYSYRAEGKNKDGSSSNKMPPNLDICVLETALVGEISNIWDNLGSAQKVEFCYASSYGIVPYEKYFTVYNYDQDKCCPKNNEVLIRDAYCCPFGSVDVVYSNNNLECKNNNGVSMGLPVPGNDNFEEEVGESASPFQPRQVILEYDCPKSGCVIDSNGQVTERNDSPYRNINNPPLACYLSGEKINNDPNTICLAQKIVTSEEFARGEGAVNTCRNLPNVDEQSACETCFNKNIVAGDEIYLYTAIGCVNTSRDALITRVFQIGLGMVGGFSIWKLAEGTFKLQERSPDAQLEGRDDYVTAIITIALLAMGMVLLRFLGIDVLGLYGSDFF